jgi:hypothetical protein
MNRLSLKNAPNPFLPSEGNSIRATCRMTGRDKGSSGC